MLCKQPSTKCIWISMSKSSLFPAKSHLKRYLHRAYNRKKNLASILTLINAELFISFSKTVSPNRLVGWNEWDKKWLKGHLNPQPKFAFEKNHTPIKYANQLKRKVYKKRQKGKIFFHSAVKWFNEFSILAILLSLKIN